MDTRIISLPSVRGPGGRVDWRIDARGLEWTCTNGEDKWMPFACVRLATLGNLQKHGWCLRLSGPPGAIILGAGGGDALPADLASFGELARAMIEGASDAGCRARFGINHSGLGFGRPASEVFWARAGTKAASGADLLEILPC